MNLTHQNDFKLDGMILRPAFNHDECMGCQDISIKGLDGFETCDNCKLAAKCPMQGHDEEED